MELSVVIATGPDPEPVRRSIRSLEQAGARGCCEVIAAGAAAGELPAWVRRIEGQTEASYAALRADGLAAARAQRVAMLSEDYTVDERWLRRALAAPLDADVVAGVTLPPPDAGTVATAAWLWEYAHLAPPMRPGALAAGEAALTPGGNAVYRRSSVDPDILRAANHEIEYHRLLFARGLRFERDPEMAAFYHAPALQEFLRDRARWSASWARPRAHDLSDGLRWAAAASRLALPPVLLVRLARRLGSKPRNWPAALAGLPLFASFACAQAYGEARAYLDG